MTGSRLFFGGRLSYAFIFAMVIVAGILLLLDINVMMAVLGSILISIICWIIYYVFFEYRAWRGPAAKK